MGTWIMKNAWRLAGMLVGVVVVIFGIAMFGQNVGATRDSSIAFGADFYTEVYRAAAGTANNVRRLAELVRTGIGYLLLATGLLTICGNGAKLTALPPKKKAVVPQASGKAWWSNHNRVVPQASEQAAAAPQKAQAADAKN